ncbi:MAG: segregation/condensation protein A [Candidatus Woesearchaeota archaeon]
MIETNNSEEKVFSILFQEDEITWQTLIYDLIKRENMDPWDVNVSVLAQKFLETLEQMKKLDFRISGKIILAAAFLLKIKSDKLINEDLAFFDEMLNDEPEDFLEALEEPFEQELEKPELVVRTPQPRKRKVSVYDLVGALEKALESSYKRNITPAKKIEHKVPQKQKDITLIINEMYEEINKTLTKVKSLFFSELLVSDSREDKVNTFIPLLYLEGQRRIDLDQEEHFGDINIKLGKMAKEYGA